MSNDKPMQRLRKGIEEGNLKTDKLNIIEIKDTEGRKLCSLDSDLYYQKKGVKFVLEHAIKSGIELEGVNLVGADLRGVQLNGVEFTKANFKGADFNKSNFKGAVFEEVSFYMADLSDVDFRGATFKNVDLRGVILNGAKLDGIRLIRCKYENEILGNSNIIKRLINIFN